MSQGPVKLMADVIRHSGVLRGSAYYRAHVGNVEGEGKTDVEAREDVSQKIKRLCADLATPTLMWDLVEPCTAWVAFPMADGWAYTIQHPMEGDFRRMSRSTGGSIGGGWSRDECLGRMREHWYQCNIQPIVHGICGLFTDRREFVCSRCGSVGCSIAPYNCVNPACGIRVAGVDPRWPGPQPVCTCGGYDSAHSRDCPRYGNDTADYR